MWHNCNLHSAIGLRHQTRGPWATSNTTPLGLNEKGGGRGPRSAPIAGPSTELVVTFQPHDAGLPLVKQPLVIHNRRQRHRGSNGT